MFIKIIYGQRSPFVPKGRSTLRGGSPLGVMGRVGNNTNI